MMRFPDDYQDAVLIKRYQRFLADVELPNGQVETVHCPNTGAMTGCAVPGSRVWLQRSESKTAKYRWGWRWVETAHGLVNIYSAGANGLFERAHATGSLPFLSGYPRLRREFPYAEGASRADFLLAGHTAEPDCLVEIKSVTLFAGNGLGYFPDAKSDRAVKHVQHMVEAMQQGMRCALVFVVQHAGIESVSPATHIHPPYAEALALAKTQGLGVYACKAEVVDGRYLITRAINLA